MSVAYVLDFSEIAEGDLSLVGGKGMGLGALARVDGLKIPPGFCVTTRAYRETTGGVHELPALLRRLSSIDAADTAGVSEIAATIRALVEDAPMPSEIETAIREAVTRLGAWDPCAVRSSATAEDLPGASFAGQQDTYLNVTGAAKILHHIRLCWASLFTDRAVAYRVRNGFPHSQVALCAIVQRMIFPEASGILFTADPLSGNRRISSIDAGYGLGEALVSGIVTADNYRVRDGRILSRQISTKKTCVVPLRAGGTEHRPVEPGKRNAPALSDGDVLHLDALGRKIEAHFGAPQDVEWALEKGAFHILQSRPITTLYPSPSVRDEELHVFVSASHAQMMTDPIRPLGLAFYEVFAKDYSDIAIMGGRMYVDVSHDLKTFFGKKFLLTAYHEADRMSADILAGLADDRRFLAKLSDRGRMMRGYKWGMHSWLLQAIRIYLRDDLEAPARSVAFYEKLLEERARTFATLSGTAVFDEIRRDMLSLVNGMMRREDMGLIMLWFYVFKWIPAHMKTWLGEEGVVDTLSKSAPHNPTAEMGLSLLDVSHVAGKYPAVVAYLESIGDGQERCRSAHCASVFFDELRKQKGGPETAEALEAFLARYGARGAGEIDITRTRWSEDPAMLVPAILGNVKNPNLTSGAALFERGRAEAEAKERELLARIRALPGGERKAAKAQKMFALWRALCGFREYPKFFMIRAFAIYKSALLREAVMLVANGAIRRTEDVYYLTLDEFEEAVRTGEADLSVIEARRADYARWEKLTPPRVITSEGEILRASYGSANGAKIPDGALPGIPVSAGTVEGRARVMRRMDDGTVEEGDILVTSFTDPSWTPVFVGIKGLVTEVGGRMTHGAVIAREYGLPAVVGVEDAMGRIKDGQRIRIDGTGGFVELL